MVDRYATPLACGRELANDIESGLIDETQLLPAGHAKLKLWRASYEYHVSLLDDEAVEHLAVQNQAIDIYKYSTARFEQDYRAENRKPSVTELLLEDDDE